MERLDPALHIFPTLRIADAVTSLLEKEGRGSTHPRFGAFMSRVGAFGENYYQVTAGDPGYITDLRMKRHSQPFAFFEANIKEILRNNPKFISEIGQENSDLTLRRMKNSLGINEDKLSSISWIRNVDKYILKDPDLVTQLMCFYVNYCGGWADADHIALAVLRVLPEMSRSEDASRLVAVAASCLGSSPRYLVYTRALFRAAISRWENAYERFFTTLRYAVTELKRFRNTANGRALIRNAILLAEKITEEDYSEDDRQLCLGLCFNLEALLFLQLKDREAATTSLAVALGAMENCDLRKVGMPFEVASRYSAMILLNEGLLSQMRFGASCSIPIFSRTVDWIRGNSQESLAEGLGYLGLFQCEAGLVAEGIGSLLEAEKVLMEDVRPEQLTAVRELLALAHWRIGSIDGAKHYLNLLRVAKPGWLSTAM